MDERKNISDMSFEEFFSKKDEDADTPVETTGKTVQNQDSNDGVQRAFVASGPKLNYRDGSVVLYIPRYVGCDNDRFETSIEYAGDIIPTGRLSAGRSRGKKTTNAFVLSLEEFGISPFDKFTLSIDGMPVYENRPRRALFFNGTGLPIGKPVGHVIVVCGRGQQIRTVKAELLSQKNLDDISIYEYDVSFAGQLWVDDPRAEIQHDANEPEAIKAPVKEQPAEKQKPKVSEEPKKTEDTKTVKKTGKSKKTKVSATIKLPQGVPGAEVMCCGEMIPLYRSMPSAEYALEGCELEDCVVGYFDASDNAVSAAGAEGYICMKLTFGEKEIAKVSFFVIPDFECKYSGNGDIPDDPIVRYRMFGEEGELSVYDENINGPFTHNDITYKMYWGVPSVTYDLGSGFVPVEPVSINIDNLNASFLTVNVTGAKKKKLYFGPDKGKKRDLTPDWIGDKISIDLSTIKKEIFASGNMDYCFYISVNSFPNRKFITIENPIRIKASFKDGAVNAAVSLEGIECVCRLYRMDKSVEDIALVQGDNVIPVDEKVIEAEVMELHNGSVRNSIPVKVRQLPFLSKELGDYWVYVSKDKRIPVPGNLIKDGVPDKAQIAVWHARIVRMNPELKNISQQMLLNAFSVI